MTATVDNSSRRRIWLRSRRVRGASVDAEPEGFDGGGTDALEGTAPIRRLGLS